MRARLITLLLFASSVAPPLWAGPRTCDVMNAVRVDQAHIKVQFRCQFLLKARDSAGPFKVVAIGEPDRTATITGELSGGDQPGINFSQLQLEVTTPLRPDSKYELQIEHLSDGKVSTDNKTVQIVHGSVMVDSLIRRHLFANFEVNVTCARPDVKVTRFDKELPFAVQKSSLAASGKALDIWLVEPLRNGDDMTVTCGTAEADGTAELASPTGRDDAQFYLAVNSEAGRRQKPNVSLDAAINFRRPLTDGWTQAPGVDVTVATQDENGTNKATLGENFEYIGFLGPQKTPLFFDLTPTVELDKGLKNRNALLDASTKVLLSDGKHFDFRPGVGIEGGKNFGLEQKALRDFTILRPKATLYMIYAWDWQRLGLQRVAFTLDATGRWLTHREPYSIPIPPSQQTSASGKNTVVLLKGFRYYLTPTLTLKLSDYYAVSLQYDRGRTPILFEDVNKVTLKLTYMR